MQQLLTNLNIKTATKTDGQNIQKRKMNPVVWSVFMLYVIEVFTLNPLNTYGIGMKVCPII